MKIKMKDYIKAIKKANRELELENETGFICKNKIFKSKKKYNRKKIKKYEEE